MIALLNQLPSEAKIRKLLRKIIFGKNLFCPHCHSRKIYRSDGRYRCRKCRKPFTLLSGTWLCHMRLSLSSIYRNIDEWWQVKHRKDIHKNFEFGLTSEIEGMFGNLRTFIRRMYHHATPEYLPEYVSEFCLRFSSPEIFVSPNNYLQKTLRPVPTC